MRDELVSPCVHVIFDAEGIPAWFGPEPVAGSERLDLAELAGLLPAGVGPTPGWSVWRDILIGHCRVAGRWQPKPTAVPQDTGPSLAESTVEAADSCAESDTPPSDPQGEV